MRDKAAPLTLDVTFELARKSLSPEGLLAWVGVLTGLAILGSHLLMLNLTPGCIS